MYRCLHGNQNSSGLQFEVAYWPALAVGSAAQLATTHCSNERTLDPQSAARQTHLYFPARRTYVLTFCVFCIYVITILL